MTGQLPPDPGPYGADTDDAVSALIDGELPGFAADHGLDPQAVAETLAEWGGLAARRSRLEAARDVMRTPITLDDPTREAMVAAAMAVEPDVAPVVTLERRRRPGAVLARVAAAAAILVVGAGAIALYQGGRNDTPTASRAPEPTTTPTDSVAPTQIRPVPSDAAALPASAPSSSSTTIPKTDFGEVSDLAGLRAAVESRLGSANGAAENAPKTPGRLTYALGKCSLFTPGTTILLEGTGTYRGTPAAVVVGLQENKRLVYVVNPDDCSIRIALSY